MFDLISIGDTVIDTFIPLDEAQIIEKDGIKLLAFPFGHKIPVENSVSLVAGNAANAVVAAARLGLNTAIYTNVGNKDDDEADDRIKAKLKKEKVDLRYVVENDNLPSNHNIVLDYKSERTILVHHQPWKFHLPDLEKTRWVYLTSLSPSCADSNVIEQIINYIERNNIKLAFQPGTFQIKMGLKKNARMLSLTQVFIVNKEEAKKMLGMSVGENVPIKKLLKGLADHGPTKVVITDSVQGSFGYDGESFWKMGLMPAKRVETTGAGDAYASATVAALFYGQPFEESLRWGAMNSASVIEQIGPQAGLLTYNQMQEKLRENKEINIKQI